MYTIEQEDGLISMIEQANQTQFQLLQQTSEFTGILADLLSYVHTKNPGSFANIPDSWNIAALRQWINNRKLWTITLAMLKSPEDLTSTVNSVSARGPDFDMVMLAATLRAGQWLKNKQVKDVA
jgi:hypothetical protein